MSAGDTPASSKAIGPEIAPADQVRSTRPPAMPFTASPAPAHDDGRPRELARDVRVHDDERPAAVADDAAVQAVQRVGDQR